MSGFFYAFTLRSQQIFVKIKTHLRLLSFFGRSYGRAIRYIFLFLKKNKKDTTPIPNARKTLIIQWNSYSFHFLISILFLTITRGFNRGIQIAIMHCVPTVKTVGYGYNMSFKFTISCQSINLIYPC
jgi:hypothetical protein